MKYTYEEALNIFYKAASNIERTPEHYTFASFEVHPKYKCMWSFVGEAAGMPKGTTIPTVAKEFDLRELSLYTFAHRKSTKYARDPKHAARRLRAFADDMWGSRRPGILEQIVEAFK